MLVREIMTAPANSMSGEATIEDAIRLLARHRITACPVVDANQRVVGVVSESDLLRIPLSPDPRGHAAAVPSMPPPRRVEEVMTRTPFTTHERADVSQLTTVLVERGWKSIPVVRDTRLVGVVSRSDVIAALARRDAQIGRDVSARLATFGQPGWRADVKDADVAVHGPRSRRDARLAEAIAASVPGVRQVVVETTEAVSTPADRRRS